MSETLRATASGNRLRFELELAKAYELLFTTKEDYAYAARLHTPQSLAAKMTAGLADGSANKDGDGIKMACKAVGIKHTYKEIQPYLNQP
jgi:hypothetical protein